MARKEQITVTIDKDIVDKLRRVAEQRQASLSSVIESYLRTTDAFSPDHKTDIQRVLDLVKEIKSELRQQNTADS